MSTWTKLLYSILLLTTHCTTAAQGRFNPAKLEYRRAEITDFEQIRDLYINKTSIEDRRRLLILPKHFQLSALRSSIERGRLFIALNSTIIVSVVKLFVMGAVPEGEDDPEAINEAITEESRILEDELRCRPGNRQYHVSSHYRGYCSYPFTFTYQPDREPIYTENPKLFYESGPRQTYVYFGGALTLPEYRGRGINTELERFALEEIKHDILRDIVMRKSKKLFYVYGVVEANATTTAHIRVFSYFVQWIKNRLRINLDVDESVKLGFFMFNTYKPTFTIKDGLLNRKPDHVKNAGYGCLIACPLIGATYPTRIDSPPPQETEDNVTAKKSTHPLRKKTPSMRPIA